MAENGNSNYLSKPPKWLTWTIIVGLVGVGIAWGTLKGDVRANAKDIEKEVIAREKSETTIGKAIEKLNTTLEENTKTTGELSSQVKSFEVELKYIRRERNRRNGDDD